MLRYILGWKTHRKIIVIESDDWGSFRFKNSDTRDKYIRSYDPRGWMHYNDCFESYQDLKDLEHTLRSVKDKNNRPVCFTFLMNPANPDFKKIQASGFEKYYFETFKETLANRNDGKRIEKWYKEALTDKLIEIGFHGREHLNEMAWMHDLKNKDEITLIGFHDNIWGHNILFDNTTNKRHRSTYKIQEYNELDALESNIKQGIDILNQMFGIKTTYFVPPDGPYHLKLNNALIHSGILCIGLPKKHNNPLEPKWYRSKLFWLGKKTKEGLICITRNVSFEPGSPRANDWVAKAMCDINKSFKQKSPAVISTHRANYVGSLNTENRINGLKQLKALLNQIVKTWPDVEFITSSEMGEIMS